MQKLSFPFLRGMIICGYKTSIYKTSWGYEHFGIDISSRQGYSASDIAKNDHTIFASGDGEVVWCQYDAPRTNAAKTLGYAIAIRYNGCVSHDGTVKDLVLRYMHCDTTFVKKGDKVTKGQPISVENKIGTNDYHLHLEMDTDTKYPQYSPQVSKGHSAWLVGVDTTVNPSEWLWQTEEFRQDPYSFSNTAWINEVDKVLPQEKSQDLWEMQQEILHMREENKKLTQQVEILEKRLSYIILALEDILKNT